MQTEDLPDETPVLQDTNYLERLRSPMKKTREQALAELKKIGPDRILDILLEVVQGDQQRIQELSHRTSRKGFRSICAIVLVVLGCIFLNGNPDFMPYLVCLGMVTIVLSLFRAISRYATPMTLLNFRRQTILKLLIDSADPRVVGTLCEFLSQSPDQSSADERRRAIEALIRLLPHVHPNLPHLPDEQQRGFLRAILERRSRSKSLSDLEIRSANALLQFMQNMGDLQALPAVERLALRRATVTQNDLIGGAITAQEKVLIAQANSCLRTLQDLQQRSRQSEALLRGSEAPTTQATELLRGVTATNETDSLQLLRVGDNTLPSSVPVRLQNSDYTTEPEPSVKQHVGFNQKVE